MYVMYYDSFRSIETSRYSVSYTTLHMGHQCTRHDFAVVSGLLHRASRLFGSLVCLAAVTPLNILCECEHYVSSVARTLPVASRTKSCSILTRGDDGDYARAFKLYVLIMPLGSERSCMIWVSRNTSRDRSYRDAFGFPNVPWVIGVFWRCHAVTSLRHSPRPPQLIDLHSACCLFVTLTGPVDGGPEEGLLLREEAIRSVCPQACERAE